MSAAAGIVLGSVLSNVMSSSLSNQAANSQSEKANQYNVEMMKQQNLYNRQMWNAANRYNSPSMQVQRLRAAGLNPKLQMVNPGLAGELTSASAQPYVPPASYTPPDPVGSALSGLQTSQEVYAQEKQNQIIGVQADYQEQKTIGELMEQKARVDKYLSSENLDRATARYYRRMSDELEERIEYAWDTHDVRVESERQGLYNAQEQQRVLDAQRRQTNWNIKYGQAKLDIEQKLADSKVRVDNATVRQLASSAAYLDQQCNDLVKRLEMDSELHVQKKELNSHEIDVAREEAKRIMETTQDYIEQQHVAGLMSKAEYVEKLSEIKQLWSEMERYDFMHGRQDTFWSKFFGGINLATESIGPVFSGAAKLVRK